MIFSYKKGKNAVEEFEPEFTSMTMIDGCLSINSFLEYHRVLVHTIFR